MGYSEQCAASEKAGKAITELRIIKGLVNKVCQAAMFYPDDLSLVIALGGYCSDKSSEDFKAICRGQIEGRGLSIADIFKGNE